MPGLFSRSSSLHARLLGLAALSAALVVGATTYVHTRSLANAVEAEALEAAGATALGVAAELTERETLPSDDELDDLLGNFSRVVPSLRALLVARLDEGGRVALVAHAGDDQPPPQAAALAAEAIRKRERVVSGPLPGPARLVAVPLERDRHPYGAVVVSLSMEPAERVRAQARFNALLFAPAVIVALTGILHRLLRDLVHRPLFAILDTMDRAAGGDLQARAPILRADELGEVAAGLNGMLERVAGHHEGLQREVDAATGELRERNRQLAEAVQRLFAARRELARSEQLAVTGQVAASMAHQIGTPLNLISGYVQMMQAESASGSVEASRLATVQGQIERVTNIVQELLDQARRPVLHRAPLAPAALLQGIAELARPTLQTAGVVLRTSVAPGLAELSVDAGQIEQVFLNLVTNSIDAMPTGGELSMTAVHAQGGVELTVSDTGQGMRAETMARIFDPLFTTKPRGRGTGLGLSIVRDVLAAHGGRARVDSMPGQGTTVTVWLPAATVEGTR